MNARKSSNTTWHDVTVRRHDRAKLNNHRSFLLWFTGLSGSGKSTLIHGVEEELHKRGMHTYALDGDNVRHGLCGDLGFSDQDRVENIRRIGEVSKLMVDAGIITLAAFISPFASDRLKVRNLLEPGDFIEIYCNSSLEKCEERDVKGLYKKARMGEIREFTGISSPYEIPTDPELTLDTGTKTAEECVTQIITMIETRLALREWEIKK
ncbi:MAG: adenylyl-sulfate kinase [Magnetococcales bacterium]|nr:adenylyl-sulfate kinase [Magnetococcales bacterium]